MKTLLKYASGMLISIFEIFVGILLLVDPISFTSGIIIAFGAILLFIGLICVFRYFRAEPEEAAISQMLFKGILALIAGAFCVFGTDHIVSMFALLTAVYGTVILVVGVSKLQKTVDKYRANKEKWYISAVSALITVICAAIILFNPFSTTEALWRFVGITLIIEAIADAAAVLFGNKEKEQTEETEEQE